MPGHTTGAGLVTHLLWSPGRGLCLWAEDPTRPTVSTSRARRSARPHPFASDAAALAHLDLPGAPGVATLLLPGGADGPHDSPGLAAVRDLRVDPRPAPRGDTVAAAWTVAVLELDGVPGDLPAEADAALGNEDEPGAPPDPGTEVLAALDAFAADLVARGRVLPVRPDDARAEIDGTDGTDGTDDARPRVSWRPVLQGPDLVAVDGFAAALPPAVRCEVVPGGGDGGDDGTDPAQVVGEALAAWVDTHARRGLAAAVAAPDRAPDPDDDPAPALAALADPHFRAALSTGLARWDVVGAPHAGPARGTFRLAEVVVDELGHAEADPRWYLEFSLQSVQDPSLRVTAASVWRDPGALRRWLDDPADLLLGELGRAARVWPELGEALRTPRPDGLELDLAGAHRFLVDGAGALDRAGFGVLLPTWWSAPARLGLTGVVTESAGPEGVVAVGARVGRDDLVDFSWRLAVDGDPVDDDEMATLVAAKAPLVRLRGHWTAFDPERLRAGLEFLSGNGGRQRASVGDVLHLAAGHHARAAGAVREALPLPVEGVAASGSLGDLLAGTAGRTLVPLDDPPGLDAVLRPYQRRGVSWLAFLAGFGIGGVLADDMGLGKTVQLLALEAHERAADPAGRAGPPDPAHPDVRADEHRPTLLVCPTSVIGTWEREAARFVPHLRVAAHHGPRRARGTDVATLAAAHDLVVTSYGTLTRDVDDLAGIAFGRLVLDEAQLVKNNRSRAARSVRRIAATHRVALTGTPVENRLAELWSVMDAVNPGLLGPIGEFREEFAVPIERHGRADVADRLRRTTRPLLLRRVKTDPTVVDDLPEKIETVERCPLSTEQASLYQVVVDEMMEKLEDLPDGVERRGRVLAAMTKLKQVCDHPALLLQDGSALARRSGKIARLEELLAEILASGERALLFTQFAAFGDALAPHLAARFDTEVAWLHGGTPRRARDAMVAAFQGSLDDPGSGPQILLLSLRAGGTGLTLTAAQHVIHLDRWWNPAVEDQATDRAFRIGQRRTVTVRKLLCAGTLEERIDDMIAGKRELAEMVVGSAAEDTAWLTGLSTAELRRVVALDPESVEDPDPDDPEGQPDGA